MDPVVYRLLVVSCVPLHRDWCCFDVVLVVVLCSFTSLLGIYFLFDTVQLGWFASAHLGPRGYVNLATRFWSIRALFGATSEDSSSLFVVNWSRLYQDSQDMILTPFFGLFYGFRPVCL